LLPIYGNAILPPGWELDYDLFTGLVLNLPRVRLQQAAAYAQALAATSSNSPLSRDWADALAPSPELVDEVLYQANAARQDAKVRAKMGWDSQ
jgi:hypothetical protein